jgi:hypothetical protein
LEVAAINPSLAANLLWVAANGLLIFFLKKIFQLNSGNTKVAAIEGSSAATLGVAAINPTLAATFGSPLMAF